MQIFKHKLGIALPHQPGNLWLDNICNIYYLLILQRAGTPVQKFGFYKNSFVHCLNKTILY